MPVTPSRKPPGVFIGFYGQFSERSYATSRLEFNRTHHARPRFVGEFGRLAAGEVPGRLVPLESVNAVAEVQTGDGFHKRADCR